MSARELQEFKRDSVAWEFFQATPPGYKKVVLHWITSAMKAETRASRFASLAHASASGEPLR